MPPASNGGLGFKFHFNPFESRACVPSQSEDDFLDESDFDDISIHSACVLSDALQVATKKKSKSGRKKKKSMLGFLFHSLFLKGFFFVSL